MTTKKFGLHDYPEHKDRLEEQEQNLGLEGARTQEEREEYVRKLVDRIVYSDLSNVRAIGGTRLVYGEGAGHLIPEFEQMIDSWKDFPRAMLADIIRESLRRVKEDQIRLDEEDEAQKKSA